MKTIKINRKNIETVLDKLEVDYFLDSGNTTIVKMKDGVYHGLNAGDFVCFKKYKTMNNAYTDDDGLERLVLQVIDNERFVIQPFRQETYVIKSVDALRGTDYYSVVLSENPCIQGVDIDEYHVFNEEGDIMVAYDDADTYSFKDVVSVYGNVNYTLDDKNIHPKGDVEDGTFFVKGEYAGLLYEGMKVEFPCNMYVYRGEGGYSFLWGNSVLYHDSSFYNVSVPISSDSEWRNMFQDVLVNEVYVNEMISSLSTDPIDMEKIKYVPVYSAETGEIKMITGITFNFHFRERKLATKALDGMTMRQMEDNLFFDEGWHVDTDKDGWNGDFPSYSTITCDAPGLELSDSLAYLDFTDNDVEMQKKKVSKSFLRLIYYNDKDPIEQSLLYYSTTFLDSGVLFGRYVKKKRAAMEAKEQWVREIDPKHIIMKSGLTEEDRVSSQITIHDEYDLTQSSEGFNLYLFAEDAPTINETKTIYMKAEFNHAGYGRTIPFIKWPMDGCSAKKVTIENYLTEALYIPVQIGHFVGEGYDIYGYCVEPDDCGIIIRDDNLIFNLFEPKIELSVGSDETDMGEVQDIR